MRKAVDEFAFKSADIAMIAIIAGSICAIWLIDIRPMSPRKLMWLATLSDWWAGFVGIDLDGKIINLTVGWRAAVATAAFPDGRYTVTVARRIRILGLPTPWWSLHALAVQGERTIQQAMSTHMQFVASYASK